MFTPVEVDRARAPYYAPAPPDTPGRIEWVDEWQVAVDPQRVYGWPRREDHLDPYQRADLAARAAASGEAAEEILYRLYLAQAPYLRAQSDYTAKRRGPVPAQFRRV